jgi:hypothetical protein
MHAAPCSASKPQPIALDLSAVARSNLGSKNGSLVSVRRVFQTLTGFAIHKEARTVRGSSGSTHLFSSTFRHS